jgi:hypothetical protein
MKLISSPLVPLVSAKTISGRIALRALNEVRNIFRKQLRQEALSRLPVYKATNNHPEIHMLICKQDFEMATITAAMLNHLGQTAHSFTFHDDGTIDDQMEKNLYQQFPGTLVVRRNVADLIASQKLSAYPALLEFRKKHIMALKLVDVALWAQQDRVGYLDSDVLFFHYPKEFISAFEKNINVNYFNRDIADAYVTDYSSLKELTGFPPAPRINAGLWVMNKKDIDLNLIESWLKHPVMSNYKSDYRLEQTFTAMLAGISDASVAHFSSGYDVSFEKKPEKSIAKHYVGRIRYGYELEGIKYLFSNGII